MGYLFCTYSYHNKLISNSENQRKMAVDGSNLKQWQNRRILVTGASSGIGKAICETLVTLGIDVIGCARRVNEIKELANKLKDKRGAGILTALECDLTEESNILELFDIINKKYGGVDALINNAGLALKASLLNGTTTNGKTSTENWDNMWNVNVRAVCICTREFVKNLQQRKIEDGHVIHINSLSGHRIVDSHSADNTAYFYPVTKFALRAVAEGQRMEALHIGQGRMRITCISPGIVHTGFLGVLINDERSAEKAYSSMPALDPKDIANSVVYALGAPAGVNVNEIIVRPTGQKN